MLTFTVRRFLQAIPVVLGVSFAVFMMMHMLPGDPAVIMAGEVASPEQIEQMRRNLGLHYPILTQYFRYITNALRGNLGTSIRTDMPVVNEIFDVRFLTTIQLAVTATAASVLIGLMIGIVSVVWRRSFIDTLLMLIALLGLSMPNFWLGVIFINFFSLQMGWLPITGWGTPAQMVMPTLMLGIGGSAVIARMTRASMLEVFNQDYIRTAYAKGATERIVIFRHALRNALIPVITVVGLQFGFLLSGAVISETIFAINGLGRLMVQSLTTRDFPTAQGAILVCSLLFVMVNMMVDITYRFVNKRIDLN
ncbi:MAG: ABC transporter permease [Defluviitaleaceae bacterium]|nr:ABC transporter permease [Defluviitaleaceae bacterium]